MSFIRKLAFVANLASSATCAIDLALSEKQEEIDNELRKLVESLIEESENVDRKLRSACGTDFAVLCQALGSDVSKIIGESAKNQAILIQNIKDLLARDAGEEVVEDIKDSFEGHLGDGSLFSCDDNRNGEDRSSSLASGFGKRLEEVFLNLKNLGVNVGRHTEETPADEVITDPDRTEYGHINLKTIPNVDQDDVALLEGAGISTVEELCDEENSGVVTDAIGEDAAFDLIDAVDRFGVTIPSRETGGGETE